MQYSPKLKTAAEEIKEILKKHDIAAAIVLHTPGYGEYVLSLQPSYSCVKIEPNGIRFRAKAEDFNGDTEKRDSIVNGTANMLSILATLTGQLFANLDDMSVAVDEITNASHSKGGHTSQSEIDN